MNLADRLKALFSPPPGETAPSVADVHALLDAARRDALLDRLAADRLLPPSDNARAAAAALAEANADALETLLRAPRLPGSQPPPPGDDPIAAYAAAHNTTYADAAAALGYTLMPPEPAQ